MNADSSVQLLAEEAVTLDMLDAGVSVPGETGVPGRLVVLEIMGFGEGTLSLVEGQAPGWGCCLALTHCPLPAGSQGELGEGAVGAVRGGR